MRRLFVLVLLGVFTCALGVAAIGQMAPPEGVRRPFPDARDKPLPHWSGPVFRLKQNYPATEPSPEAYPWKKYDFRSQWREYLESVLLYCLEGNVEVDWAVEKNRIRSWYHVPWLHWGLYGREFVHGLTMERHSRPEELARTQTSIFQNWAVSVYNAPGGYTIGRVWRDPDHPDPGAARFPEGSVSVKVLFTQATPDQVPYVKGSKEWQAFIYEGHVVNTNPLATRTIQTVRLLQIDVAVRDSRADATTGWVFGAFVYDGDAPGRTPWERMVPVGLMWGNDPDVTMAMIRNGAKLEETRINTSRGVPFQHLGWGGRLSGPVDNPISSCLSCHSTAQWKAVASFSPPRSVVPDSPQWMQWFRNLKPMDPFTPGEQSLDYSLQLASGFRNFHEWQSMVRTQGGARNSP